MINSTSNKQVKRVVNLRTRAKARREEGVYVVEGLRMCRELPPGDVDSMFVTEGFAANRENKTWLSAYSYETVTDIVMGVMADTQTPQGVLAVARQKKYTLDDILKGLGSAGSGKRLAIMILETLQDPGNLGTIIRASEGAGITGIVMNRETADIYNPKVIRSTMGSIYRMPFVYVDDLKAACGRMKGQGVRLFAAHLKGMNNYDQEDYTDSVGFLIGNEAGGLKAETADLADCYIKIPMAGEVESLNAAVAASVLMFEVARQRRNG
ncbi:MAG: RNA methyltransferase [Clostridium sp.]|nr:RNA methyltransferase [Clostridium sp.]